MPLAPSRPCASPGCSALVARPATRCAAHSVPRSAFSVQRRARDRARGTAHERGYDARWRTASRDFLARYPLCAGVLIATAEWTPALAETFHILRELARERGELLAFRAPRSALRLWLAAHPIYRVEPWDLERAATVVDHIIPHRGDPVLFWAEWNWQALSKRAHDKKTAREDRAATPAPEALSRPLENIAGLTAAPNHSKPQP